ncbi:bifunctional metallophosphatase/5'-nucleotidase [Legionella shakespearei]|uniref:5'-nucleotidase n=1 Tax=Legionella shakespearei DSM 23087 TaxID=1122169 RepID=A0A0W0YSY1_9GAMM|nr:bifunctional metallophosphatase/5'-nucleotidase [Legionella shakespearei]KTD59989.1 5'-nucleotidase [Legionella shakespearei DSM 23087]
MLFHNKWRHTLISLIVFSSLIPIPINHASALSSQTDHETITIKILGINDFHGQISTGRMSKNKPVGGAAVLAAYLKQAQTGMEDRTLITIMGDQVGASPPSSGLLHDEPSILFTNSLGNKHCTNENRMNPLCNIVATVGNHEFDRGQRAMFDLIYGTDNPPTDDWISLPNYPGSSYPYISANIVDEKTEKPLFPPYSIKVINNIRIAFIGAVLKNAADSMFPANAEGVIFLDEAKTINHYIPEVKAKGAQIIVVLIHEGGNQIPYEGETRTNTKVEGSINAIVDQLDDDIDVVMGGHTHQFLNAFIPNHNGINILVTQANSYSASFAEVTLQIDAISHKVKKKSAQIITTYADRWPGKIPDEQTQKLVQLAEDKVAPIINSYVGTSQNALLRKTNAHGESNLGNLVADALRTVMNTDIGMTNPHGMRDDISPGTITWGKIYSVLPFSNNIVSLSLSGEDIYDLLEQQWMGSYANMLQISGINYSYDSSQPIGHRIIAIQHKGKPLNRKKIYTIAAPDFLASGNGVFSVMKRAKILSVGANDHDTVIQYLRQLPQPFEVVIEGRIKMKDNLF